MSITIMRKVKFCAGHRLLNHEGKCANLHGHNYLVEFHVTGNEVDSLGRVVDFSVLNKLFKGWIDENWDHGFVLWDKDHNAINAIQSCEPHRLYLMPYNPTAENMARYLMSEICPRLIRSIKGYDLQMKKVVLWETEHAYAEVTNNVSLNQADALLQNAQKALG
jgi:6-pyruvoyltetrahydropterin/6-carboxytetrahydropterin synthase